MTQTLLAPFGLLYGAIAQTRTDFYQKGWLKSADLGLPVVSVGNLTVGGTGKTPLVSFVARVLAEQNHKVCILTRGYKRLDPDKRVLVSDGEQILSDARTGGDEPFELATKLLGIAAVVADKNRVEAGFWAKENLGATAFVLDDGFQHLRLERKLDVVTIDATNPFGNGKLLPAGILREPLAGLKRAEVLVLTRADSSPEISNLKSEIKKYNPNCPILLAKNEIKDLKPLTEILNFVAKTQNTGNLEISSSFPVRFSAFKTAAFCALGNPASFFRDLEKLGLKIVSAQAFPDHYAYRQADVEEIERKAKEAGAEILVTTMKDAVKLEKIKFGLPCFVAEAEIVFDNAEALLNLLKKL
ncbi:MAG: tetraacyldisaccharide 4'-kinase [Acidobacteriota bacterium]|nr:tetraacyldisaccharide 4'-kinase [Acidobacteriota bacterium]